MSVVIVLDKRKFTSFLYLDIETFHSIIYISSLKY